VNKKQNIIYPNKMIHANSFIAEDANGKEHAMLGVDKAGPTLFDEKDKPIWGTPQ